MIYFVLFNKNKKGKQKSLHALFHSWISMFFIYYYTLIIKPFYMQLLYVEQSSNISKSEIILTELLGSFSFKYLVVC
jgi:hypothetical protein